MMLHIMLLARLLFAVSGYQNAQTNLMPLVVVALMLDAMIVSIWYFIGSILNNSRVKGAALGEFYQFIGTIILIGLLIGSMTIISSALYSSISTTKLMSPTAISTLCNNLMKTSQLNILGSSSNSLLAGVSSSSGNKFPGFCSLVNVNAGTSLTDKLNYPLAAAAVVVANLTNQTAANLNYSFTMDAWLGFLSQLSPVMAVCIGSPPTALQCLPNPLVGPIFRLELTFTPYAGYNLLLSNLTTLGSLLNLSVESFLAQMFFLAIFLYMWPWLFFGGLLLRSTIFTRRIGGLLIAIAVAGLVIYPTIFAIEYTSLGNGIPVGPNSGNPNGLNTTYGFNAITTLPATPATPWPKAGTISGNYVINFFVEPNIKAISWSYSCWPNIFGSTIPDAANGKSIQIDAAQILGIPVPPIPPIAGILGAETADIGQLIIPLTSAFSAIKYLVQFAIGSTSPSFNLISYCRPTDALKTFFAMLDAYGIIGLVSYLIPLINIIITMSSIFGISQLLGGDVSLAGIGRLV
jgi:hypothetical protein